MTSASQDHWQDIMDGVRSQLEKQVPLMPAMTPEEQKLFIEAINAARWGEEETRCFDVEVADRKSRVERGYE